jgi:hypothetical protein
MLYDVARLKNHDIFSLIAWAEGGGWGALFTGKSAGCPALPACGRQVGGDENRPCNHIYIARKPRPLAGELPFFHFFDPLARPTL